MKSKVFKFSLFAAVTALVVASLYCLKNSDILIGTSHDYKTSEAEGWKLVKEVEKKAMLKKAQALLPLYFSHEAVITRFESGPAGTLIFDATIGEEAKSFVLLADKETLVEGIIYNPFMTSENITDSHGDGAKLLAQQNQEQVQQAQLLKEQFKRKVQHSKPDLPISTENESRQTALKPFTLPEVNSVLSSDDKEKFYESTSKLENIELGKPDAPLIYVFFDFNCPGCLHAKKVLKKHIDAGQLRVKYIPVGLIGKDSPIKAAYSLIPNENTDREVLFEYFNTPKDAQQLIKKEAPEEEVVRALSFVRDNNETFLKTPKKLTPAFIFKLNGEVVIANLTSEQSIQALVTRLNKQKSVH